ncbi:MAG: hypothetical protein QXY11_02055 [Desulfurococcaceae archaeon]
MSVTIPRALRRKLAITLGIIGLILLVVGLATGYIDIALFGIFVGFTGQAIILQERKRPG